MKVKNLRLKAFRNYKDLSISFYPSLNIFQGKNGQGKTNLLEAVYFLSTGRSHRTNIDKECIFQNAEEALLQLSFETKGKEEKIEIHLRKNGRKAVAINGYPARRIQDLFGRFHVVIFSPEDLSLVKGAPSQRRRFMDLKLCQVDPVYLHSLQSYYKALRQRNQLLKDVAFGREKADTLFPWDEQIASFGCIIMEKRKRFVSELQKEAERVHETIAGEKERFVLQYEPGIRAEKKTAFEKDEFLDALDRNQGRDLRLGQTSIGPHHDDLGLFVQEMDLRVFGSQGQQRTGALSLKIAELELTKKEIQESPVLLLDDVMSELDRERQEKLSAFASGVQTVLTCTGMEDSIHHLASQYEENSHVFTVTKGKIAV